MNRELRRAMARSEHRTQRPQRPGISRNRLKLAACPWKLDAVWSPLERILGRLEIDGTIDTAQGKPVLHDDAQGGWYEIAPAIDGLVDFHRIAAERMGAEIDLQPLTKLANKLRAGSPIFAADLAAVRACADRCKRLAARITVAEAESILTTVRISAEMERARA